MNNMSYKDKCQKTEVTEMLEQDLLHENSHEKVCLSARGFLGRPMRWVLTEVLHVPSSLWHHSCIHMFSP